MKPQLSLAPRSEAPENVPTLSERATQNPTPVSITIRTRPMLPLAYKYTNGYRHIAACITHPRDIHVALFLTRFLKFSQDFRTSKPKRSKRLFHMSCPTLPFFSIRDRTIGVGLCDNLANEQIKVSFY